MDELELRAGALEPADNARLATLREQEAGLSTPEAPERMAGGARRAGCPFTLVLVALLPLALLVRLVTLPWRGRIAQASERAHELERARHLSRLLDASRALEAEPDDPDRRFARGLAALAAGRTALSERDFDASVEEAGAAGSGSVRLAAAHHNRGVARARLRLPRLAARDAARARDLGLAIAPAPRGLRALLAVTWFAFRALAGLGPR
ncbi:MAG: hypothetical protein IT373_35270 [Polyangiaceae bacterium]|nr:hypothetical protein [Polyangiaceae bacterium]